MTNRFMDGYDDPWGPAGRYGGKLVNWMAQSRAGVSVDDLGEAVPEEKFNNEGEKQMEKIDWSKPLWALRMYGDGTTEPKSDKVYTFKSGKQRVIWVEDRVYPVDDNGYAVADVNYGEHYVTKGYRIVENVPEEKFFVGLARQLDGVYWLTDCGQTTTMGVLNSWKRLMADQPHWIVDTRKSAEPPKAIEHDPEDYITVWFDEADDDEPRTSSFLMTKSEAEACVYRPGEQVVRVRTTPAPVDTSRYIQLYRRAGTNEAWRINALDGRQEFTWEGADKKSGWNEYVNVKVRD